MSLHHVSPVFPMSLLRTLGHTRLVKSLCRQSNINNTQLQFDNSLLHKLHKLYKIRTRLFETIALKSASGCTLEIAAISNLEEISEERPGFPRDREYPSNYNLSTERLKSVKLHTADHTSFPHPKVTIPHSMFLTPLSSLSSPSIPPLSLPLLALL